MALNTARLPRQDLVDLALDLRMGLLGWLDNRGKRRSQRFPPSIVPAVAIARGSYHLARALGYETALMPQFRYLDLLDDRLLVDEVVRRRVTAVGAHPRRQPLPREELVHGDPGGPPATRAPG